jgi:hypothetical protein
MCGEFKSNLNAVTGREESKLSFDETGTLALVVLVNRLERSDGRGRGEEKMTMLFAKHYHLLGV